jgi:inosine-uridine nucleoside N-ribohydrolase
MQTQEQVPVVGIVDNVDPDNPAQILALMSEPFDLKGVVVTGRAANHNPHAATTEVSRDDSLYRTLLNAVRMRNFMDDAQEGHEIPVFVGTPAPRTIVPHKVHIDELEFEDLRPNQLAMIKESHGNGRYLPELGLAGNIIGAKQFLNNEVFGQFDMVVGGPMTDTARLLRDPEVANKTRAIYAQFGMFGFGEQMLMEFGDSPRGRRQFNVACDPEAAHDVLTTFRGDVHLYPTDVTRVDAIGFDDPGAISDFLPATDGTKSLVRLYDRSFDYFYKPRNERIFIHDIAPALGCAGVNGVISNPYTERPVDVTHVPYEPRERNRFGEIDIVATRQTAGEGRRFVATEVDSGKYLAAVQDLISRA